MPPGHPRAAAPLFGLAAALACSSPRGSLPVADGGVPQPPAGDVAGASPPGAVATDGAVPDRSSPAMPDVARADTAAAPPAPGLHRLTLRLTGPGEVLVDGQVVACPGTCALDVDRPAGTRLVLRARVVPEVDPPTTLFLGWAGECGGKAPSCAVTFDRDVALEARFHRLVLWEKPDGPAFARLAVLAGSLWGTVNFDKELTFAGRTFRPVGAYDALLFRYGLDGESIWFKAFASAGDDFAGLVWATDETTVSVPLSLGEAMTHEGVALPKGYSVTRVGADGRARAATATAGFAAQSPFRNGSVAVEYLEVGSRLVRRDGEGRELWQLSAPSEGSLFGSVSICDAEGGVIATQTIVGPTLVAGVNRVPVPGKQTTLVLRISPEGKPVFGVVMAALRNNVVVVCGDGGEPYLLTTFAGELELGGRVVRSQMDDEDIAVARLARSDGSLRWLTSFGTFLPDAGSALTFVNGDPVLTPFFTSTLTVGDELHSRGSLLLRLAASTGAVMYAVPTGRSIHSLVPHEGSDFFFSGRSGFGRLSVPPL